MNSMNSMNSINSMNSMNSMNSIQAGARYLGRLQAHCSAGPDRVGAHQPELLLVLVKLQTPPVDSYRLPVRFQFHVPDYTRVDVDGAPLNGAQALSL
jgi:hypothetical protein